LANEIFTVLKKKKNILLNFKPVTRISKKNKKRSADKKLKNNKKKQTGPNLSTSNGINVEIG
jgi:hypothetical protein